MNYATLAGALSEARFLWSKMPFKAVIAIAVFLQFPGESFPFSNFPMYSSPGPSTTYYFVTDGNDQPIALSRTFRVLTSETMKIYWTRLKTMTKKAKPTPEQERVAGKETLEYILKRGERRNVLPKGGLKLYRVDIRNASDRLQSTTSLVAVTPASPQPGAARP